MSLSRPWPNASVRRLLIPFAFVPLTRASLTTHALLAAGAGIAVVTYFSINPHLYGYAKYQAEYAVPFAVAGAMALVARFSASKIAGPIIPVLLMLLIGADVVRFVRMPEGNKRVDELLDSMYVDMKRLNGGYRELCAFPFDYRDAYQAVKFAGQSERAYSIGWTSGVLPEIMHGYTTRAMRVVTDIAKKQVEAEANQTESSPAERVDSVERDPRIKVVLLGATALKPQLLAELLARGWHVTGNYRNARYGSTVVIAQRNGS